MIDTIEQQYQAMHSPELVMPAQAQWVLLTGLGILAAVLALMAIRMSMRNKDWTPLAFFVAGTLSCFTTEALSDMLTHFTHAQIGAIVAQISYAHVIPLHVVFIYSLYFGAWYMFAYPRMRAGTIDAPFMWKGFAFSVVVAYFFEAIPIALGFWAYFEPQPLWWWKGTLPPNFAFMNAFSILFGMVAMDKLRVLPAPTKYLVMLIAGPCFPIMGHIGAGQPYYLAMNSGLSQGLIDLGGLATMGTCTLGVWLLIQLGGYGSNAAAKSVAVGRH